MMKKIIFVLYLILLSLPFFGYSFDWNQCEKKDFILTAYYSPLENQAFYYKKDFLGDKILNGEGKFGASGKVVINGMLAGPSSYDFGGKFFFPDLGVGEILDRGGAIVEAGEKHKSDRIDIWMGYGEEGLIRALDFGVQRIQGYYCDKEILDKIDDGTIKVGFDFNKIPIFDNFFDVAIWKQNLSEGRKDIWVYTLQKYLIKLGYLSSSKHNGSFDSDTKKALCNYQVSKNISYFGSKSCGIYGLKTRYIMQKDIEKKGLLPSNLWKKGTVESIKKKALNWDKKTKIIKNKIENNGYFDKPLYKNTYSDKTVRLQYLLNYLGFYNGDINGIYDDLTIQALYQYQLDRDLLKGYENNSSIWGYFGPATRRSCNEDLIKKKKEENNLILNDLLKDYKKDNSKKIFNFYRPYTKNEGPNKEIRILQKFLQSLDLYNGKINGIYDKKTVDSVFDFQVKYGLLDENSDLVLRGFLGPNTRKRINGMRNF